MGWSLGWCYRNRPAIAATLRQAPGGLRAAIKEIAWKAQQRFQKRHWVLMGAGKDKGIVVAAWDVNYWASAERSESKLFSDWSTGTVCERPRMPRLQYLSPLSAD